MDEMILKILGVFFITFSCGVCGYSLKFKHNIRIKKLENLLLCLDVLEREISLTSNTVIDTFTKVLKYADDYNIIIFKKVIDIHSTSDGEPISVIWDTAINEVNKQIPIYNGDDVDMIKKFGDILGCGDITQQKENLDSVKKSLSDNIKRLKLGNDKLSLSPKIGMYVGIAISVFLI